MIVRRTALTLCLVVIASITLWASGGDNQGKIRKKLSLNQGWHFHLGETGGNPWEPDFDDSDWQVVHVPHSLKLTSMALDDCLDDWSQPTFHRDFGWYRKTIKTYGKTGGKVFLEFEGAHQVTDLWVNGQHVGQHGVSGYTPFHFDISDFIRPGEDNLVCLKVDNRKRENVPPDPGPFDYIKFSGLYRDVYLVETHPVHISFNWEDTRAGIRITTPSVDLLNRNATICVETQVKNESSEPVECALITRIIDAEGLVLRRMKQSANLVPGGAYLFSQSTGLEEEVHFWSCEDPYLYRVNTSVLVNGKEVDCVENPLGIRKIELNMQEGFLLNGKPFEFMGVNRHQHHAYVGDAVPNSLHFKDVKQIKDLGFNVIRTAHYTQDDALLEACDELGILVYEEAPSWISVGDEAWLENYYEATRRMVRNHRNHPSLVIWGAGINHRGYVPGAHYAVKLEDPTRFTATNNSEWTGLQASGPCDIFSNMDYKGIPDWKQNEYLLAMEGGGGPEVMSVYKSDPLRLGMISWTAHAYYTFARNEPGKTDRTRGGMMDIFRIPKWGTKGIEWYRSESATYPLVYFTEKWKEGITSLTVYSNCEEVEILVNGIVLARQKPDSDSRYAGVDHPPFTFLIKDYEPGVLKARGYLGGREVAKFEAQTPEEASKLSLEADLEGREFYADGSDIVLVYARIMDTNGTLVSSADREVKFSVDGPAEIVGDREGIGSNPMESRHGIAPILLRAGTEAGEIVLKARAKGLEEAVLKLESLLYDPHIEVSKPYFDAERLLVDLGGIGHIVQFDWQEWTGDQSKMPPRKFGVYGDFTAELKSLGSTADGLHCFGEINVYGINNFAIGDGVLATGKDGMELSFEGLEKGEYMLKTWHYAPQANYNDHDPAFEKWNEEIKLNEVPFAGSLVLSVDGGESTKVEVGTGSDLGRSRPGISELRFNSTGEEAVKIHIRGAGGEGGTWMNCFELIRLQDK